MLAGLAQIEQIDGLALFLGRQPHAVHHGGGPLDFCLAHGTVALGHPAQADKGGAKKRLLDIVVAVPMPGGELIDAVAELDDHVELVTEPATQRRAHHTQDAAAGEKKSHQHTDHGAEPHK